MLDRQYVAALVTTLCLYPAVAGAVIPETLETRIERVTGPDAVACGEFFSSAGPRTPKTVQQPAQAARCAREALGRKQPFWLVAKVGGIDSMVVNGLLADRDGQLQAFQYDSDPSGEGGATPTFIVRPCRALTTSESPSIAELMCAEDR